MKTKKEIKDIQDMIMDVGINLAIGMMQFNILKQMYKECPEIFWQYIIKTKCNNLKLNCRM